MGFGKAIAAVAIAALVSGCSLFDDEEILSGERIRIRDQQAASQTLGAGQAAPIPAPVANADWTQTNARATHASGHLAGPSTLTLAWRKDAGISVGSSTAITSAPIVVGGRVYVLDAESNVAALDAGSGSEAWRVSLAPEGEGGDEGFGGGLAADDQRLYATTGFGEVIAIDRSNGGILWRQRVGAPFRAAPAVASGAVVAVTRDNRALAINAASGQVIWRISGIAADASALGGASPAIAGDLVVMPFASGEVIGAQLSTGRRIWSAVLGGARRGLARSAIADVTGDPVIAGRAVITANQSGRIVAIDGQTGQRGWTRSIGSVGPIWAAGQSVYLVSDDGAVMRLALQTGKTIWRTDVPVFEDPEDREDPIAYSGPVLTGGNLLVTDSLGNLLSFDPATGQAGATVRLSDGTINGVVVAGGTVYVLTNDGNLSAFR